MNDFQALNSRVAALAQKWGIDTFSDMLKQHDKLLEEAVELRDELLLREVGAKDATENAKDELGDVIFVALVLSLKMGVSPLECLERACDKNEKRAGKTINGTFVKDSN